MSCSDGTELKGDGESVRRSNCFDDENDDGDNKVNNDTNVSASQSEQWLYCSSGIKQHQCSGIKRQNLGGNSIVS